MPTGLQIPKPSLTLPSYQLQLKKELTLFLVLLFTGTMWFYLYFIGPREKRHHPSIDEIKDTHGDLFAPWFGARELLINHRDPYSPEVTREIQNEYYGKALTGAPHEPKDEQRFAYPVFVAFLFSPFLHIPFNTVRSIFVWLLPMITMATIPAWLRLAGVRISAFLFIVVAAFTITALPIVRGLDLQQLTLLVAGLLAACAVLLLKGRYFFAGVLLALTLAKPQMSVLLSAWLMFWTFSNWQERKRLFWGFFLTLGALCLAGEHVLPGWMSKFLKGVIAYRQYASGGSLLELYLSETPSWILTGVLFAVAAYICWRTRQQLCTSLSFAFTFCAVLVISIFVVPALSSVFSQVLLLPALLLSLRTWDAIWRRDLHSRSACLLFASAVFLPWGCAFITVAVALLLPTVSLDRIWGLPLYGWLPIPFAILGFIIFTLKDVFQELQTSTVR
jgi:hypothetical protein